MDSVSLPLKAQFLFGPPPTPRGKLTIWSAALAELNSPTEQSRIGPVDC